MRSLKAIGIFGDPIIHLCSESLLEFPAKMRILCNHNYQEHLIKDYSLCAFCTCMAHESKSDDPYCKQLYSQLITLGFEEATSLHAARKFNNIEDALNWFECNKLPIKEQPNDFLLNCNGNSGRCIALERVISLLKFYNQNYQNYDAIAEYLEQYKHHLIEDYHHLLNEHVNEDKISKLKSNCLFQMIYNEITKVNNITCDVKNCKIYSRNNRQREITKIQCKDKKLELFIDIIDTIHCYFLHSIDIGYRIPKSLLSFDQEKAENGSDNIDVRDSDMKALQIHLSKKNQV